MRKLITATITLAIINHASAAVSALDLLQFGSSDDNASLASQRCISLAAMNQNTLNEPCITALAPKIKLGGFLNTDITPKRMQKTLPGEGNAYFALSNAGINIDARAYSWLSSHVGIAYYNVNKGQGDRTNNTGLLFDDGYLTIADLAQSPLFAQAGQFYLPFGDQDRYAIAPSLTQLLTITREAGIQGGIADWHGLSAVAYLAQGALQGNSKRIQGDLNFGLGAYFSQVWMNEVAVHAGVQYMFNMLDTNAMSEGDTFRPTADSSLPNTITSPNSVYTDRVGGIAAQASVQVRQITLFADYVTALGSSIDIVRLYTTPTVPSGPIFGAQPSAWDAGGRFNTVLWQIPQQVDFTFSQSFQAAGLHVFNATGNHPFPRARYTLGYTATLLPHVFARLQYGHDWLYKPGTGDTGRQGDDIKLRLGLRA